MENIINELKTLSFDEFNKAIIVKAKPNSCYLGKTFEVYARRQKDFPIATYIKVGHRSDDVRNRHDAVQKAFRQLHDGTLATRNT